MISQRFGTAGPLEPLGGQFPATQSPTTMRTANTEMLRRMPPGTGSPAVERLTKVKQSLNALSTTLKDDVDQRKEQEEAKLQEVRELAIKIEKHLTLEIKRRSEADKILQSQFEQKLKEIAENVDRAHSDKMLQMQVNIDILTKKMLSLERELGEERERTARLAAELRHAATTSTSDLKAALEQEKVSRVEKEAQILRKISEDVYKVQERADIERASREAGLEKVREEFAKALKQRDQFEEKFRAKTLEEIDALKQSLRVETEMRESGEEQLAHSVDGIVQQLHDTLKQLTR
eukprot:TRINITY_DN81146_c0_g1_i1.p1 TRINITY_DN81146_c0_g1~~TRINITY_DN81146_c0_g1_i1.p1  ORF type:complete len:292 (+),score=82.32 TRINITY_DN81146_c0_g1_i1:132-1007(+)